MITREEARAKFNEYHNALGQYDDLRLMRVWGQQQSTMPF